MCEITKVTAKFGENHNITKLAGRTGIPLSTLNRKTNPNDPLVFNIRDLPPVTIISGDTTIISQLCVDCGGSFIPALRDGAGKIDIKSVAKFGETAGITLSELARAVSHDSQDGPDLSLEEARALLKPLQDVASVVLSSMEVVTNIIAGQK